MKKGFGIITKIGLIAILCIAFAAIISNKLSITANAAGDGKELSGEIEVIFNRNVADMQPYIEAFEKKYPDVDVIYTCYNDFETSIKSRLEEGDYGDVLYFPSFIATEESEKYFEPLGDIVSLSEKYNYVEQGRVYANQAYAIPASAYLVGIIYNKEVFDKAGISELPTTIDDFLYAMDLIDTYTDAIPYYTGYNEPWTLWHWEMFPFIEMTGSASYRYNEFIVDKNPFRAGTVHYKVLSLLYELVKRGYTEMGKEPMTWWDSVIKINSGEIGCSVMGTWALTDYKNVGPGATNIAFMPFPNNIDGSQYVTVTTDYSYAVSKNSTNKAAAKAFVRFMLDESGYAFNHDTLSIVKTDPYPECYGDMTQTIVKNSSFVSSETYSQYAALSADLNLANTAEYMRIIEAAAGMRNESFDDIMNSWNIRWEALREPWMVTEVDGDDTVEDDVIDIENTTVSFSENELKYINENKLVRVGYHANLAPLSYKEGSDFAGIAWNICDMISEKSGLDMEFYSFDNTGELVAALDSGEIDVIAGIEKHNDITTVKYSKEYLEYMDVLVRHDTIDKLVAEGFVEVEGEMYGWKDDRQKLICSTTGKSIEAVQELKADYAITNYYSANYYIRKNDCDSVTVIPYANDRTYHMGFSKDANPILIAIINKCLYSLKDGEIEIALMGYVDAVVEDVTIKTFVKNNPTLCIAVITIVFVLIYIVLYERYKAKNKQALEAKKYELLASLADEYFFEYDYKKGQFRFDSKFGSYVGFDSVVKRSQYTGDNSLLNQFMEQIDTAMKNSESQFTIMLESDDGRKQWYRVVTSIVLDKKKQPVHMIGKIMNIQKEMEEVASYQDKAHRDALTKLYNREGLSAHLPKEAEGVMIAVMDMDDFKQVNDTLGHGGGDYALMYFADKLEQHMGTKSLVARYGGDEFIAVLTGVSENEAKERLEELVKSMNVSLRYAGNSRKVSISVGAVYSDSMDSFEDMFDQADKVLYQIKEEGKNSYTLKKLESTSQE